MEQQLVKSEKWFRLLAEALPQIVWVCQPDGKNIYFNQQWVEYTGLTLKESYGDGWNKPFHPDDQQRAWDAWQNAVTNNGSYSLECRLRRKDGEYRWWLVKGNPLLDNEGRVEKWFGTCTNIEEIKQKEEALRESEERYRSLFEQSTDGIYLADSQGHYMDANSAGCSMLGYSRDELLKLTFVDILDPSEVPRLASQLASLATGEPVVSEWQILRKDGSTFLGEIRGKLLANGNYLGYLIDITERKQTEAALSGSRSLLRTIIDTVPMRIFWKDQDLRYLGCNPVFAKDAGVADAVDMLGKDDYQLGWKEQAELYRADDRRVMDSGISMLSYEEPQTTPDGKTIWLRTSKVPLRNAENETMGVLGIYEDITKRKQTEFAMLRSEDNLTRAQAVAQIGSWHLDIATGRLEWTAEAFRIFGIPQKEAVDLDTFFSTVYPDDREMVLKSWNEAIAGAPYDIEHRVVVDGKVRWVRERAVIERDSDGRALTGIGTTQDITERMCADLEIRRLEREFRSLAENLPDIVSRFDRELRRIYVNPELEKATGIPREYALGKTHMEIGIPEQAAEIWTNALRRIFFTGEPEMFDFSLPVASGVVKYYQVRAMPEFAASGEVESVLTIARDISTLKGAEAVLREGEERFNAMVSNMPGMVFQCYRHAGKDRLWFIYVSNGATDLLDIDPVALQKDENEFIGRIVEEGAARTFNDSMARSQAELTLWNWEGRVTSANGIVKWVNLRATPRRYKEEVCMWEGIVVNVTENKTNEENSLRSQTMLRELSAHLESVREEERKIIAREIHDELGQTLTALRMDVSLARINFGESNPKLMKRLQSMTQLVDRTIDISRHVTSRLRPSALDLGIVAALEWLVEEFIEHSGISCELAQDAADITMSEFLETAIFRIIQEALTNITRHAAATQAEIIVTQTDGHLYFEVLDNGNGFDPHSVASRTSFGLIGMRERVEMLEGNLTIDSAPGQGTRIRVCIPVA